MNALELSAADFRRLADRLTRLAEQWLAGLDSRRIAPATHGAETEALFTEGLPETGLGQAVVDTLPPLLEGARAGNARFLGYVLGSGEPVGALGDYLASVLNQNVTAWRSSPVAVSLERAVVRGLAEAVGCPGFTGSLTGGGSMANLMGLAMAREARAPVNEEGAPSGVVYASSEVHMSIPKAMALLGLGRRNLRLLPTDAARLELLAPVPLSAVCFRYTGEVPEAERDAFNARLLARLNSRGRVYLSNATLAGRFALRACFVNHRTTPEDVETVVFEVLEAVAGLPLR